MDSAQVYIVLLSPHFLASKFVKKVEMPKILKRAKEKGVLLLTFRQMGRFK